jgi:hypothetical protein
MPLLCYSVNSFPLTCSVFVHLDYVHILFSVGRVKWAGGRNQTLTKKSRDRSPSIFRLPWALVWSIATSQCVNPVAICDILHKILRFLQSPARHLANILDTFDLVRQNRIRLATTDRGRQCDQRLFDELRSIIIPAHGENAGEKICENVAKLLRAGQGRIQNGQKDEHRSVTFDLVEDGGGSGQVHVLLRFVRVRES